MGICSVGCGACFRLWSFGTQRKTGQGSRLAVPAMDKNLQEKLLSFLEDVSFLSSLATDAVVTIDDLTEKLQGSGEELENRVGVPREELAAAEATLRKLLFGPMKWNLWCGQRFFVGRADTIEAVYRLQVSWKKKPVILSYVFGDPWVHNSPHRRS